ncbi:alpha/beta hydrolase [Nocardia uniformis]|uniref:Alpha/beta hydrolase n=1 Tax=Nocardia uniformis TaxID=53432 RepID=A0A849BWE8_9NOCA|nr:alpha/beta hydrolase [Nocardia uniformis]NNH70923.1 alpha/beta hydrolase [Nocardia uniformis]
MNVATGLTARAQRSEVGSVEHRGGPTWQTRLGATVMRAVARPALDLVATVIGPRTFWLGGLIDPLAGKVIRPPGGTTTCVVRFERFRAEWVTAAAAVQPGRSERAILYLHGGGFFTCGLNTHRRLVATLSAATGVPVLNVDYRQLPGHAPGESIDDAVEAYEYLLGRGIRAENIVVAGDSAGGFLAFSVGVAALRRGLPVPAGIVGLSPWLDLDSRRRAAHVNNADDALLSAHSLDALVRKGFESLGPVDPAWSPVSGPLAGMPPALIQVGSTEVLRSDAELMTERLGIAGVPVRLQIWRRQVHVFQAAHDVLPEAREAITDIAEFVTEAYAQARNESRNEGKEAS